MSISSGESVIPIVLIWSGLFMYHHEFADGQLRPTTEESPLPQARRVCFPKGRLYHRLCQVAVEPALQRRECCSVRQVLKDEKSLCYCARSDPRQRCLVPLSSLVRSDPSQAIN